MQKIYIEHLPIPPATSDLRKQVEELACQIIESSKNNIDTNNLENEIDAIIYDLFSFTQEEIAYIENLRTHF